MKKFKFKFNFKFKSPSPFGVQLASDLKRLRCHYIIIYKTVKTSDQSLNLSCCFVLSLRNGYKLTLIIIFIL